MRKLFVWDGVLNDHGPGIAFAFAEDAASARRAVLAQTVAGSSMRNAVDRAIAREPVVFDDRDFGFFRHGSA